MNYYHLKCVYMYLLKEMVSDLFCIQCKTIFIIPFHSLCFELCLSSTIISRGEDLFISVPRQPVSVRANIVLVREIPGSYTENFTTSLNCLKTRLLWPRLGCLLPETNTTLPRKGFFDSAWHKLCIDFSV